MKKIIITILIIITLIFIGVFLITKLQQPKYNPLDSRTRMQSQDFVDIGTLVSAALPVSPTALTNLKKNLPITTPNFTIIWNSTTNRADVELYAPYNISTSALLTWLGEHHANSLPLDTLYIIKK